MTTSPESMFLAEISDTRQIISAGKLAYFQERQRNRLYDFIVSRFLEKERANQITKAQLARRIKKSPEQITRWLSTPGNWTLDTISDLALGIFGGELGFSEVSLTETRRNERQIDSLHPRIDMHSHAAGTSATHVSVASNLTPIQAATYGVPYAYGSL